MSGENDKPEKKSRIEQFVIEFCKKHKVIRSVDLRIAGFGNMVLSRMVQDEKLVRLNRGTYCLPENVDGSHTSVIEASRRLPRGVICLASALHLNSIGHAPEKLCIAIPYGTSAPRTKNIGYIVVRMKQSTLEDGMEMKPVDGVPVRVHSVERALADCVKFRRQFDELFLADVLHAAVGRSDINFGLVWRFAEQNRCEKVLDRLLELNERNRQQVQAAGEVEHLLKGWIGKGVDDNTN